MRVLAAFVLVSVAAFVGAFARDAVRVARGPVHSDVIPASARRHWIEWSPPRCSSCMTPQRPGVRMVAGRRVYLCEVCVHRFAELLDSPEDITRFL